ncbi:MAG: glycosyltransferase family 4 protein [Ignavibacteriae bacterium]|nr:glycosyltransferase family 4 protein [Ignavibacteriota bacterium]
MNILHLTKDYTKINGITTAIENLIAADKLNFHYVLSNFVDDAFQCSNHCIYLNTSLPISVSKIIYNIFKLKQLCKKYHIGIIHCHHRYFDLLASSLKCIIKIEVVTTVHSKVYGKKILSYKADKLVAVGESIKEHLIDYFRIDEKRIAVINNFINPNVINVTRNKNEIIEELNILPSYYIVGYVGRFDIEEKGIDILLDAIKLIIKDKQDIVFIFIGDGADKNYIINESKEFETNIRVIGSKIDIFNYMQIFDMIILSSRIDPFPLVMLEAAYLKIPFIGSNVDGIPEIIEHNVNGILFESENAEDLAKKIEFLLENADFAQKLGENLYKKVIENYTAEKNINKIENLYRQQFISE